MKFRSLIPAILTFTCLQVFAAHPGYLGVVNKADGTASIINLETGATDSVIKVGYLPHEIASSADGSKVFVSNYGKDHVRSTSPNNRPGHTLSVISLTAPFLKTEIDLGDNACAPHGLEPSKDGEKLYVTCEDRQEVVVLNMNSLRVEFSVPTNQAQSHMVVVSADQSRAYVANFSPGTVSVLDLKNKTILAQIKTGPGNEGVALAPNQDFAYASSVLGNTLFKIDTKTLEVVQSAPTDRSPVRVLVTPNGKHLLVNNSADGTVQIFNADTLELESRIKVGKQPIGIVVPNDQFAYVANMNDNKVSEIDLEKREVVREFLTGTKPDGITYIPAGK
jgi:YVTN family beta-propeller protein